MGVIILQLTMSVVLIVGLLVGDVLALILLMECTMFIFLFLVYEYNTMCLSSPCIKYFYAQSLGSVLMLVAYFFYAAIFMGSELLSNLIMFTGLSLKFGLFPMHFWVVPVCEELPYLMLGVLGVPMKVLPLNFLLSFIKTCGESYLFYVLVVSVSSMITGMILGLYSSTIRKVLGASSITHSGWFLVSSMTPHMILYFILYSISLGVVVLSLMKNKPLVVSLGLLSLSGLPPFMVFFGKLFVLGNYISMNISIIFVMPMLFVSVFSLLYYLKYSFCFFLLHKYFLWPSSP